MSLRPVDWHLSMWNLEQRAQEGPKDPASLAALAARQVEVEKRREEERRRLQEASRAASQRPIEAPEERESGGRGGRSGPRKEGKPRAEEPKGSGGGTSFEAYG